MTAGDRAKFCWQGPSVLRRFGRSWKAWPRCRGEPAISGLLTGGAGRRRRRPRTARAGGASARHRRPACAGGQPARHEGKEPEGGEASVAAAVRRRRERRHGAGAGGGEEAGPRGSSRALSLPSYQQRLFLLPRPPSLPPRRAPAPDGVAVRPGPARAAAAEGGPGGAGRRGLAAGRAGAWLTGKAAVGRRRRRPRGGWGNKRTGEVTVNSLAKLLWERRLERRGEAGCRLPQRWPQAERAALVLRHRGPAFVKYQPRAAS